MVCKHTGRLVMRALGRQTCHKSGVNTADKPIRFGMSIRCLARRAGPAPVPQPGASAAGRGEAQRSRLDPGRHDSAADRINRARERLTRDEWKPGERLAPPWQSWPHTTS
jgi:hypothetical protein